VEQLSTQCLRTSTITLRVSYEEGNLPENKVIPLQLIKFVFERNILRAVRTVVVGEAAAAHFHVFAHVYTPRVVRVSGEEAVMAYFHRVGPTSVLANRRFTCRHIRCEESEH
jgi:hypothetical protein